MPFHSSRLVPIVVLCLGTLAHAGVPVVSVEPPCPQAFPRKGETKIGARVAIRYNPMAPGAALKESSTINLLVGGIGPGWGDDLLRIPMVRGSDGQWEASVEPKQIWVSLIFYFQDGRGRVDDNRTQYWDVLGCYDGALLDQAVDFQARSYTGMVIGSGIQRQRDYKRAVAILESDLQAHPEHTVNLLANLWEYKVQRDGDNDWAYRRISREIERFLDAHPEDKFMLLAAGNFIGRERRLPSWLKEKYLNLLRPFEREYANFKKGQDWATLMNELDPATKVKLSRQFLASYPDDVWAPSMYPMIFRVQVHDRRGLNDLPGGEETFRAWAKAEPANPDVYASMAHVYINRAEKLEEAERLLVQAFELYTGERPKKSGLSLSTMIEVGYQPERDRAWLRFLRGKLRLAEEKPKDALPDLEEAAKFFKNRQEVWFALGQAQEHVGMKEEAIRSYLEAATMPAQESSAAQEALERMFAGERPGGPAELEARLLARLNERRAQAAAEYTPTPIDRPLPDFRMTTLAGREVTARKLRGRPAILNFWSAWCTGCMIELPRLDEFQKTHREVSVLAVAWSSKPEDVRSIIAKKKLSALQMAISEAMERDFGSSGVPTTLVVDAKGRIRFIHNDMPDVIATLEKDLAYLAAEK